MKLKLLRIPICTIPLLKRCIHRNVRTELLFFFVKAKLSINLSFDINWKDDVFFFQKENLITFSRII